MSKNRIIGSKPAIIPVMINANQADQWKKCWIGHFIGIKGIVRGPQKWAIIP
jgi:hypothetical protein